MHLLKLLLVLCIMLAASACGSDPVSYRNVQHPNYGQADFDRDSYQCARENTHVVAGTMGRMVYSEPQTDTGMAARCMQARGWQAYYAVAEQGDAAGQFNLGLMYTKGQGVPQDYVKAHMWWNLAAAKGYAKAQFGLGYMYANGQGVPQDYVQAHKWFNLAATQNDPNAITSRDIVAKKMTPAQISEAQKLAREWKPK